MPSPNAIKIDTAECYYHVYARGSNRQPLFMDDADFVYFQTLLGRYLSVKLLLSRDGSYYPNFAGRIELLCYCLMVNHFHLLIYQVDAGTMAELMRSLMLSYSIYFNLKYKRTGHLFESRYKAAIITDDSHLEHMSRYVHMNPRYWKHYAYSSLKQYVGYPCPDWLRPQRVLSMYPTRQAYYDFLLSYDDQKKLMKEIKHQLAC